jgi:phosphatidylinositol alpha-mannosyltransferase
MNKQGKKISFNPHSFLSIMKDNGWTKGNRILGEEVIENTSENKTRILVVAPYFCPKIGGMEKYAYNIAKRLNLEEKYEVVVVTSNHESRGYKQEVIDGMRIYRLPISFNICNTPINLSWYWWMKKIIAVEKPDLIHAHAPVPYLADVVALLSKNIPLVLTYHSGSMLKGKWPVDILIWVYEKFFLRLLLGRADVIVAVSKSFFDEKWGKMFAFKTQLIQPGVDNSLYAQVSPSVDSRTVSFIGRVEKSSAWKGIEQLLEAMVLVIKKYPDVKMEIVGGGDAVEHYKDRAQELGISSSVIFYGFQTGQQLVEAYSRSSVVVLPSVTKAEAFGIALLEAMSAGRPVIGSDIGGISYLIKNEKNGLLVPPQNPQKLANAIGLIFDNKLLVDRIVKGGFATARGLDWSDHKEEYDALFSALLGGKASIAQIVAYYPPHTGGMEVVAKEISLGLAKENHSVTVFTSNQGIKKDLQETNIMNYKVHKLKSLEFAHTPIIWTLLFRLLLLPKDSILHVHLAQLGLPEISYLAARIRKFPIVMHFHLDVGPSGKLGFLLPFYKKYILGPVLRRADRVIVFSKEQLEMVKEKYNLEKDKIAIIPNGVASDFFYNDPRPAPANSLKILFVGRLSVQKRVDLLIRAISFLDFPAELIIVGDGEDRQKLENLAVELKLNNIKFVGRKSGKDLIEAYRTADVFAITSEKEGMPLVVLEAMASGLPIVGSDVIGIREIVKGVGVLVEGSSPENFADALGKLWRNPENLKELSRKSREEASKYSWEKLVGMLENIYKEIKK